MCAVCMKQATNCRAEFTIVLSIISYKRLMKIKKKSNARPFVEKKIRIIKRL